MSRPAAYTHHPKFAPSDIGLRISQARETLAVIPRSLSPKVEGLCAALDGLLRMAEDTQRSLYTACEAAGINEYDREGRDE